MTAGSRTDQLAAIRAHCSRPGGQVLFDEPASQLFDVFSGRSLALDAAQLSLVEPRTDKQTHRPYLLLVFGDGRQLALTDAGIAFPPDTSHTGPLPELSEAVCFRDFTTLLERFKHEVYGHPDQEPTRGTVKLLMMCVAILTGARHHGFDVSREEKELDHHLTELEKRAPR